MHQAAEDYCNGDIDDAAYDTIEKDITKRVSHAFGWQLPKGFMVNADARGYALKLDGDAYDKDPNSDNYMPLSFTDWGGYGILAPAELEDE